MNYENEVLRTLCEAKSVRVYEDRPVEHEKLQMILNAAFHAPTAGNQMLYSIIHVTEPARKEKLAILCDNQSFIAKAPVVLVFVADQKRWTDTYRAAGCTPRKTGVGDMLLAISDTMIAAQNATIAAESLEIGCCYIGDILERCEEVTALLGLPELTIPVGMVVMGYPVRQQKERPKPVRFEGKYIVSENTYHTCSPDELREMYLTQKKANMAQHRQHKNPNSTSVSSPESAQEYSLDFASSVTAFWKRKYESEFSKEMNRSAAEYLKPYM
ncbi:nitroreductase family protein [Hespellia stercorisuis]|uniref:FMN reductase (NADPH) n=1 Tax=Hespellia stercorisuis DSM 15480 TaxID=1121950 RepID=A0A1M6NJ69_9FIRM|nr:nitroreductase family protein [Hespellia stercorisuis]SHJ95592.1 FMN reductase (NADPH) [Hespellia stercorisuis DSM 15480]